MTLTDNLLDQVGRLLSPDERSGMLIPAVDVAPNVRDEGPDGIERASAYRLPGQDAEPDFDEIEPRGAGGREVKLHARMRFQPREHRGRRMRRRVVENKAEHEAFTGGRRYNPTTS